jgi:hypothetical protein
MVRRSRKKRSLLETALRGGAAGMAGGLAISFVEREVLSRVAGGTRHRSEWDDLAARGLSRVGLEIGEGRGRIATGMATQLVYAGVLGAAYAVLREQTRRSRPGRILLDAGLTYAATLVFPDRPKPTRRPRRLALRRKITDPLNPADAFMRVTAMTIAALTR